MFKYKSPLKRILEDDLDYSESPKNNRQASLSDLRSVLSGGLESKDQSEEAQKLDVVAEVDVDSIPEVRSELQEDADILPREAAPEAEVADVEPEISEKADDFAAPSRRRKSRVKTTFLGFERSENSVQSLMDGEPAESSASTQANFPVGWLVVINGPGRGTSITLVEGLMQMGRNDDQAIQLDFGDLGISRENHAVVAYDAETRKCYLGHGGKANLVRLNGSPVLSTEPLSAGDKIRISDTTMQFVPFCDETFDWRTE